MHRMRDAASKSIHHLDFFANEGYFLYTVPLCFQYSLIVFEMKVFRGN